MEPPNLPTGEEKLPLLERAFWNIPPTEEDRAVKREPGESAGELDEDDD
jgi:hypothetical protein